MNRLNHRLVAISMALAGTGLTSVAPAHAQPMMGEMSLHHDAGHAHERMQKQWQQHQAELKTRLHLAAAQEGAWVAFVQGMKVPAKGMTQALDRDALAKLTTPERIEKMTAIHEANLATMQTHIKQRSEVTRTFYSQLSVEQQKVFDAETLPKQERWKGKRD